MSENGATAPDLISEFPAMSRADWLARASLSLSGRPVAELGSRTADGIQIEPIYGRAGEPLAIPGMPALPPLVMPLVIETEPAAANEAILGELEGGAGGVVLQMASPGQPGIAMTPAAVDAALAGVQLGTAKLSLAPGSIDWTKASDVLATVINRSGNSPCGISFGADPIGAALMRERDITPAALAPATELANAAADIPSVTLFNASGIPAHAAGATEAQELAAMLASGVAYLRALEETGHGPRTAGRWIGLELSADGDVFLSIAKLRAARLLWVRVLELCGDETHRPHLHVRTSARMMAGREVHVNMLRTTAASLAAAIGGADTLTVLPFTHALGKPDRLARRIARNQMIILAGEAYVGMVADPAAGSGYIEHLTEDLAARAWALFREIDSAGGTACPAGAELLRARIGGARKTREAEVSDGRRQIVGVNAYENADDLPPVTEPWPA